MRYLWVIGGGQLQIPLIEEAQALGLKTIVSDMNPGCVARGHADMFVPLDIFDTAGHVAYLDAHPELDVAGVLAAGIDAPETMAAMNERLGLKGVSPEAAALTKNKHLFRQRLQELGYPVPAFVILTQENKDAWDALLGKMPYPVIVKPVNNSGSRDMKIFDAPGGDVAAYVGVVLAKYPLVLVEEMWTGPEQTVECLLDIEGTFHRGFITDRHFTFDGGFPVETGLTHPTCLDAATREALYGLAERLAADLDIRVGAVKLDTIVTADGPRVIEMTVRHSGGFDCQYLVPRATGKNVLRAAILTAIQERFDPGLLHPKLHRFGRTASIWPSPGVVTSVSGVDEAMRIPGVEEIFLRYGEGDRIEPYIDCAKRAAFIIATGETRESVEATIARAVQTVKMETR